MAILTSLSKETIAGVADLYGVRVARAEGVLAGSVNTNYAIVGEDGERYFLRLYEEQAVEGAMREARLLEHLARSGVPTPAPIARRDGQGHVVVHADKAAALFPYVDGTIRCQKSVSAEDARAVGEALGHIHRTGEALSADERRDLVGTTRFGVAALHGRLSHVRATEALPAEIGEAVDRLRLALNELASLAEPTLIPLVHGDLFRDNVLFAGDALAAVLDFESASNGSAAFDLAVTLLAWCYSDELERGLARSLVAGYLATRTPTNEERAALYDAARMACVRFATTRITDYELRPRGLGVYKDFRRWTRRLEAVEKIGPAELLGFLGFGA